MKFRIWNNEDKRMYHSTMVQLCAGEQWQFRHTFLLSQGTPMQFTGRADSAEHEIYEGDVVKCERYTGTPGQFKRHIGQVVYSSHDGAFRIKGVKQYEGISAELNSYPLEVLGNIYENPELLTK